MKLEAGNSIVKTQRLKELEFIEQQFNSKYKSNMVIITGNFKFGIENDMLLVTETKAIRNCERLNDKLKKEISNMLDNQKKEKTNLEQMFKDRNILFYFKLWWKNRL